MTSVEVKETALELLVGCPVRRRVLFQEVGVRSSYILLDIFPIRRAWLVDSLDKRIYPTLDIGLLEIDLVPDSYKIGYEVGYRENERPILIQEALIAMDQALEGDKDKFVAIIETLRVQQDQKKVLRDETSREIIR